MKVYNTTRGTWVRNAPFTLKAYKLIEVQDKQVARLYFSLKLTTQEETTLNGQLNPGNGKPVDARYPTVRAIPILTPTQFQCVLLNAADEVLGKSAPFAVTGGRVMLPMNPDEELAVDVPLNNRLNYDALTRCKVRVEAEFTAKVAETSTITATASARAGVRGLEKVFGKAIPPGFNNGVAHLVSRDVVQNQELDQAIRVKVDAIDAKEKDIDQAVADIRKALFDQVVLPPEKLMSLGKEWKVYTRGLAELDIRPIEMDLQKTKEMLEKKHAESI